ncbi:hypothetical protein FRC02_001977 [Tulasnella sp. 418]|nr:hypothetical protein FRC02_001977 [Tulasnella sp. 418]
MSDSVKRPIEDSSSGREKKKRKLKWARTIPVQDKSSLLPTGPNPPSDNTSMTGLPSSIQAEKFANARAFEINAIQNTMQKTKDHSSKRVWQTLPRHLRRRAASHDVRRVPVRLREKAKNEMDPVIKQKKMKKLAKRGKGKEIGRTENLMKRQRDKTWLETHIWHAKRMKMDNLWGYRLAVQPTEKAFRPSHRAAVNGSIIHDASYFGTIELIGKQDTLKSLLSQCCDPRDSPNSPRYINGARICETYAYGAGTFPFQLISPITVMWKPLGESGEENETNERVVWVRVHPASFQLVHEQLRKAISAALQALQSQEGSEPSAKRETIEIADLRNDINAFEIIGPRSNQVLAGALKLIKNSGNGTKSIFRSLKNIQTSGSIPRGMIIGFTIQDPRLSYPPTNAKPDNIIDPSGPNVVFTTSPSAQIARSDLWNTQLRQGLQKPKYKKKDIDQRRSQSLVPGVPLQPQQDDDHIPLMLIQRTISSTHSRTLSSPPIHGWTLLLPAGWSMPLWSSLTHIGTRVAGLRERHNQHFEAATPHYPEDFVTTTAYEQIWRSREEAERDRWERTPKAKRVAYEALGVRSPFRADWEVVLGLNSNNVTDAGSMNQDLIPTQPGLPLEATPNQAINTPSQWLLRGSTTEAMLRKAAASEKPEDVLHESINDIREKGNLSPLEITSGDLLRGGLILAKITLCTRGAPDDLGIIYEIEDEEEEKQLREKLSGKKGKSNAGMMEDSADSQNAGYRVPDSSSIIGYITTGHFSLQQGHGFALGAVSVSSMLRLMKRDAK